MRIILPALWLAALLAAMPTSAAAQSTLAVIDQGTAVSFPDGITFHARVTASAGIDEVVLEYGADQLTCGEVLARAYPSVEPGTSAAVSWTWDMDASGSQPPGATIWYRWRLTDKEGFVYTTETKRVTWLDSEHAWRSASRGQLTIHAYEGGPTFVEELLSTAEQALARLGHETGVATRAPIDLYIYADSEAMRGAILHEPGWAGGVAYPEHGLVAIGIAPDDLEWGRRTVAHELTHVLVGYRTFSCLGVLPTWLNEGLAVYGEGGPDDISAAQFADAVADDRLLSAHALSAGFSADPERAGLSYTQSYSMVRFLVDSYGRDKLLALLDELSGGTRLDAALRAIYGFDLDGLESGWRDAIGAGPVPPADAPPAAASAPTPVPTYEPVRAQAPAPTAAAMPDETAATSEAPAPEPTAASAPTAAPLSAAAEPVAPAAADPMRGALSMALLVLSIPLAIGSGVGVLLLGTRRR